MAAHAAPGGEDKGGPPPGGQAAAEAAATARMGACRCRHYAYSVLISVRLRRCRPDPPSGRHCVPSVIMPLVLPAGSIMSLILSLLLCLQAGSIWTMTRWGTKRMPTTPTPTP